MNRTRCWSSLRKLTKAPNEYQIFSDTYGVNINVAQFQYFKNETGQEFLARIFLIEQSEVEQKAISKGATNIILSIIALKCSADKPFIC